MGFPGIRPSEAVIKLLRIRYADRVSSAVAEQWGLSQEFLSTFESYQQKCSVNEMSALTRALYYGRLCATLHMLHESQLYTEDRVRFVANYQGLHPQVFDAIWLVLKSDGRCINEVWGGNSGQQQNSSEASM